MSSNNPRYKLTPQQIESAKTFYEDHGWKIFWLCIYFQVNHKSIRFHARTNGWVRRVRIAQYMPKEIAEIRRQIKKQKYDQRMRGTYDYIKQTADQHKINGCQHVRWVKRCSLCGEILGSDATHNH